MFYLIIKRTFDLICGLIGCIFLLPITIVIKIAYMISGDFHSIFYSQTRVGKNGKEFKIYKFRSMVPNADEVLKELLKDPEYKKEWKKYQKFSNDPRITKIGKVIRHGSIDETPQFFNVLIGQLSMIGPRPLVPGELKEHNGDPKIYESVKPGITGWWAVNGRSEMDYKERLELEYYYIKNRSLKLDAKIFFKTFLVVGKHEGAK